MTIKAEIGYKLLWPQTKRMSGDTRNQKRRGTDFPLKPLEAVWSWQHLGFKFLASEAVGKLILVVLSHEFVVIHYSSPRTLISLLNEDLVKIAC